METTFDLFVFILIFYASIFVFGLECSKTGEKNRNKNVYHNIYLLTVKISGRRPAKWTVFE